MNEEKAIGAIVKAMRVERNWTLNGLAERSMLSVGYLSDIERGRSIPTIETLNKIAAAFEVEPGELLNVANGLTAGEYRLLDAWRSGKWAELLALVSAKMAEEYEQ